MIKWAYKWACPACWRKGTILVSVRSERLALELAIADHATELALDRLAAKVPAGMLSAGQDPAVRIAAGPCYAGSKILLGRPKQKVTPDILAKA